MKLRIIRILWDKELEHVQNTTLEDVINIIEWVLSNNSININL